MDEASLTFSNRPIVRLSFILLSVMSLRVKYVYSQVPNQRLKEIWNTQRWTISV